MCEDCLGDAIQPSIQNFGLAEEALPPDIKDQTLGKLKSLMPIETKLTFPPAENEQELLIMKERNVYRDYIEKRFPQLAKIVDADWYAKMRSSLPVEAVAA